MKRLLLPVIIILIAIAVIFIGGKDEVKGAGFTHSVKNPLLLIGSIAGSGSVSSVQEIAELGDIEFLPVGKMPTFGFSDVPQYIKLRVFNFENRAVEKVLEVKNPILNVCNLYEIEGNTARVLFKAGDEKDFSERPVPHINYQFPVWLQPNSTREFILKVSAKGEQLQVPIGLWTNAELSLRDEKDRLLRGIYFGIILFVLLFNLFIYLIIKEKSTLWYVFYVFALLMLQLSLGGFAHRYFWPESTYLTNIANPFFASASIFALIKFTQQFLNLKEFYPRLNKVFALMAHLVAINMLLALIYTPLFFKISVLSINTIALILNAMILPTVIMVMRKNFKPARYFLYAFIILVGSVFLFILNNFGLYESDFYATYGLQIGSALEVILLSFAIVDKFKIFREEAYTRLVTITDMKAKANEVLEKKVTERTHEIAMQKQIVEKQKEEIVDSIRYAERIQKSILPTMAEIEGLFGDNFVLFKPRDIVSGDFYWFGKTHEDHPWKGKTNLRHFAAVDCTGHGVPGALMSMLGHNSLEQCLTAKGVESPGDALDFLNNEIIAALQHDSSGELNVSDGMDIAFCTYDPDSRLLSFAGAKNNLYILRNGEFIELKGDRKAIGLEEINADNGFTNHEIRLDPGDMVYTFTDGYPDQFGGDRNKKLKSKTLLQKIADFAHLEMDEQKNALLHAFDEWRGENEQIDDVCMLGIKIL
ncbi:SpoIIE family protein phosphatase [Cryomorpha ignava]|uniref:SpoIIE family protein phosphatase n=1 Tax=Cryomorpha ignava TaxID=101383 RepID=A0A7K3WUK2_9FLAO|nr:7TM diverse intracellular signaling domain-containing protein [Cryomorpha ignava]NEN24582.1 SpoIIE family protein phosphatase [Cryomorpha ignava]